MLKTGLCIVLFALAAGCAPTQKPLTDYVNPLLGTATLWDSVDLGFKPTKRTWGAEVFPGSSLPNAMVQVSPVTKFHSGAGYQYEDSVIYGFTHTNKGHWNLCHIPLLRARRFPETTVRPTAMRANRPLRVTTGFSSTATASMPS